uniref:AAA domain-containing protein n=1 Tax=Candidatus Kentrum sp. DK TaxID=2126562 RepID=A0A450SG54_9GAMM|nr:MAG: AAA domain-containing protein [Candidatus Kentron sp. DK]
MEPTVYLMRGLPSCGKSYTAKRLAGAQGVVCETDDYFYTQVGDDPARYDYRNDLLPDARAWNYGKYQQALSAGITPIIVDRGNSLSLESQRYARLAADNGYRVMLAEPESPWWQEIRVLLKYRRYTLPVLWRWADKLAEMSRRGHRVPVATIRRRMERWKHDLSVEDILAFRPSP